MSVPVQKRRLILHAGTSKTGTSTLQFYLDRNREALKQAGILYPLEGTTELRVPKHQWMVPVLRSGNQSEMRRRMDMVIQEAEGATHTIILSTEGIFNHWWDFADAAKDMLGDFRDRFEVSVWIWFREPVAFFASYYLQALRNPRIAGIPAYGHDHALSDLIDMPWAVKHLEYRALLAELGAIFGDASVYAFSYSIDIVTEVCGLLAVPRYDFNATRENATSITSAGLDILRIVNRYQLGEQDKERAYNLANQINALIGTRDRAFAVSPDDADRIRQICGFTQDTLDEIGRASHTGWAKKYL